MKHIDKGKEICVNYGKGYWVHRFGREALELHSIRGKKVSERGSRGEQAECMLHE